MSTISGTDPIATPATSKPIILPKQGMARVKNVMSGDTVVLLGKPLTPNGPPPEVIFTLEALSAPRYVTSQGNGMEWNEMECFQLER